ncbi:ATP-dependent DNA helicase [Citrus sinensis]|uniref:ATP-dependent DNA helicase n=1 Tax=Citrus sinensis TaxID=2711 RepID=A0ACB8N9E4_CITSI|nr:ATP-dependent DNA helicase [Citrus sinensis]
MALTVAVSQSCGMCFGGKQLRCAIILKAGRGCRNVLGTNMRFSNLLLPKIPKICSRSKHKYAECMLKLVEPYDESSIPQPKLLKKASVVMGYDSLNDLFKYGRADKDAMDDFDISLACKRFPCITLGSSPPVGLYDETKAGGSEMKSLLADQSCEAVVSNSMDAELRVDRFGLSEAWPSLYPALPNESSTSSEVGSLPSEAPIEPLLDKCISCVPGLSKRLYHQLENCGFYTLRKLLHHFPRTYADLQNAQIDLDDGQYFIFIGEIISSRGMKAGCSFSFLEVIVGCEIADTETTSGDEVVNIDSGQKKKIYLHLKKFFRGTRFTSIPFLKSIEGKHKVGEFVCVSGKVRAMRSNNHYEMREYNIDVLKDEDDLSLRAKGRPYPIYPSKGGLNASLLRDTIARALQALPANFDPVPKEITQEFGLLCLFDLGRLYQMLEGLGTQFEKEGLLDKYRKPRLNAAYMEGWSSLTKKLLRALPYSLTSSQLSAISEIIWDLKQPVPMNRLLQGDVGCGKTVVAFLACMEVIGSGYQDLQTGDITLVIGTHSLIAEKVEFSALRLAIVDEQQRFGVVQRGRFNSMAMVNSDGSPKDDQHMAPHVLAMSATPIPRTLALALYGDMSLTQITDLPPGRIPIKTYIIEGNEKGYENVYKMMLDELQSGGKVYLVYPVIEQSEQLPQLRAAASDLETISQRFQDYSCGLLHGKMKSDEKDEALRRFRSGETHILLSTQVIEIGVDVPDASMMIVMNAERFGIAQLHQLRGRVGRGVRKSQCILVASSTSSLSRLKVLEKSSDGFYLANMDLLLRGPGDLLGKKQSGHLPEFPVARLEIDGNILQEAHMAALRSWDKSVPKFNVGGTQSGQDWCDIEDSAPLVRISLSN